MRQARPSKTDFIVMIASTAVFMAAFSWAAIVAEREAAERDQARAECVTDAECEAAWGFDMYGNR